MNRFTGIFPRKLPAKLRGSIATLTLLHVVTHSNKHQADAFPVQGLRHVPNMTSMSLRWRDDVTLAANKQQRGLGRSQKLVAARDKNNGLSEGNVADERKGAGLVDRFLLPRRAEKTEVTLERPMKEGRDKKQVAVSFKIRKCVDPLRTCTCTCIRTVHACTTSFQFYQ